MIVKAEAGRGAEQLWKIDSGKLRGHMHANPITSGRGGYYPACAEVRSLPIDESAAALPESAARAMEPAGLVLVPLPNLLARRLSNCNQKSGSEPH
jgi:hypothetical protein